MSNSNKANFSYYFFQNIFSAIVPLISLAIFTRVFSPREYGVYALLIIFGNLLSSIITFGLKFSYEKLFFELDENNRSVLLQSILLFCFLIFILFLLPIYVYGNTIINYFEIKDLNNNLLVISYMSSNLISFSNFFLLKYRNDKNAKSYSYLNITLIVSQLLVSILLIIYFGYGIEGFFYSNIIVNILIILFFTKDFSFNKIIYQLNYLKEAIIIGIPLFPKIFIGFLNTSYDKILLGFLKDQGSLGVYDISYRISYQCYNFCIILNNTFLPDFYLKINNLNEKSRYEIPNFLFQYFILYILFCSCLSYFSFEIVTLFLAKEFYFTINISSILCMFFSFYFFQTIPILVHLGESFTISKLTAIFFIISLSIVLPGTYYFGIYGLALGLTISNIINSIIYISVCQKKLNLYWNFKIIFKIYFYFMISSTILIFLREVEFFYILRLFIKLCFLSFLIYYANSIGNFNVKLYFDLATKKIFQLLNR